MNIIKLSVLALGIIATASFAKNSSFVGFCSGYLLMTGRADRAVEVIKQSDNLAEAQAAVRFIVNIAKSDPDKASERGAEACRRIGEKP